MKFGRLSTATVFALAALGTEPAQALDILFTDIGTPPMSAQEMDAFEQAGRLWEARFDDPIEMNVNVKQVSLGSSGNLAQTLVRKTTHVWLNVVLQMIVDADDGDELGALFQLDPWSIPLIDLNGARDATFVTLTTANAKALGLTTARDPNYYPFPANGADATIKLNSDEAFDFDPSDGITAGHHDAVSIILHELDHAMGQVSQVDSQDNNPDFPLSPMLMDIWRFTVSSTPHNLFGESRIIRAGFAEYDDSVKTIEMSQGYGTEDPDLDCPVSDPDPAKDGRCDASHFRGESLNVMAPAMKSETIYRPTAIDRHVLDYIGWDHMPLAQLSGGWDEEGVAVFGPASWRIPPIPGGGYPAPLPFAPSTVDFRPNLAVVVPMDFAKPDGQEALGGKRTLFGYLQLRPKQRVRINPVQGPVESETWETLYTTAQRRSVQLPPSICQAALNSDREAAVAFAATLIGDPICAPFDPNIGRFGGWRLPMCLQAVRDMSEEDDLCDARMVLMLALDRRRPAGTISARKLRRGSLTLLADSGAVLQVFDAEALGF